MLRACCIKIEKFKSDRARRAEILEKYMPRGKENSQDSIFLHIRMLLKLARKSISKNEAAQWIISKAGGSNRLRVCLKEERYGCFSGRARVAAVAAVPWPALVGVEEEVEVDGHRVYDWWTEERPRGLVCTPAAQNPFVHPITTSASSRAATITITTTTIIIITTTITATPVITPPRTIIHGLTKMTASRSASRTPTLARTASSLL